MKKITKKCSTCIKQCAETYLQSGWYSRVLVSYMNPPCGQSKDLLSNEVT